MGFTKTGYKDVEWIQLAQDTVKWQATVNNVGNFMNN
jgi:hypothetical protein